MSKYLDLLPTEKKAELRRKKLMRTIVLQEIAVSFPVILFIVALFSMSTILETQSEAIKKVYSFDQSQPGYQDLKKIEEKFEEINKNIIFISRIQNSHVEWNSVMADITNIIPGGVYLTEVSAEDFRISLIGKSRTRDEFLAFQRVIEESECFINVEAPLSNLVTKEDVDFQINFEVEENCLKNK